MKNEIITICNPLIGKQLFYYRHAELVSASYGIPKQVRDDGRKVRDDRKRIN